MKNNRISAAYNPNEPRNNQNYTQFGCLQILSAISRTRYRESNSPRQDHSRSNSSNQSSRDNSRERNSNRFQFRDKKINGFFVDNQQGEFNLN